MCACVCLGTRPQFVAARVEIEAILKYKRGEPWSVLE